MKVSFYILILFMIGALNTRLFSQPKIVVRPSIADYGTVPKSSDPYRSVYLVNVGTVPTGVLKAAGSCGCLIPS